MSNLLCRFCNRVLKRACHLANHEYSCASNPEKKPGKGGFKKGYTMSQEVKEKISWKGRTHSDKTKQKISESRISYLKENPDQVPYLLNHYSKGESFPEKYWREVLEEAGIQYEAEKQVGRFRIDFAIGNVALEIDGEQHYTDERIVKSNARRDEELSKLGWKTTRVRWASYRSLTNAERDEYRIALLAKLVV